LLKAGLIDATSIFVNSVSGATGAGKTPSAGLHFPNLNENLYAYKVGTHRHTPEMEQICSAVAGEPASVLFQPHIGSYDRGILSTIYATPKSQLAQESLAELYKGFYAGERFVQVLDCPPQVKSVAGTNYCHIFPAFVKGRVVIFSAIDNLMKGASSQAIQNMNVMFGFDEAEGLL
jgi:N-acetyl-gamma-glutamyl-phosphate reductase